MSSTLLLPTIASALLLLSSHVQGIEHRKFFPSAFKNINKMTFPFTVTTNRTSDMVLVKCPLDGYRHIKENDGFERNNSFNDSTLITKIVNKPIAWILLEIESSGSASIHCGRVNLQQDDNGDTLKSYKWIYNVKWGNALNADNITTKELVDFKISSTHGKCEEQENNVIILTKKKEGGITKVNPDHLENSYVYQKFYYFEVPNESNKDIIQMPCGILIGYNNAPKIILLDYETLPDNTTTGEIKTIKKEGTGETEKAFDVELQVRGNLKFYRGEQISLTKMRYIGKNEFLNISKKLITSRFKIKGYELVKLEYYHQGKEKNTRVSKMYYFGPPIVDFKLDNLTVPYVKGDKYGQPNCSNYFMTIGYLEEIVYNREKYVKGASSTNEKFKKSEDFYFLKENSERKIFLECIYRTPGGKITTRTNFVVKESEKKIETSSNLNINIYNAYNLLLVSSLFIMILRYL